MMTISVKFCRGLTDIAPDKIIIRGPLNTLKKKKDLHFNEYRTKWQNSPKNNDHQWLHEPAT